MHTTMKRWTLAAGFAVLMPALAAIGGCGKEQYTSSATTTTPAATATPAPTVPAPPGDSTPKPADTMAAPAMPQNEKTGTKDQSTTGTASSGAPPYSMQGAPEGNPAPSQGTKPTEQKK